MHHELTILALDRESGHTVDAELFGGQALGRQRGREPLALIVVLDVVQRFARHPERSLPGLGNRECPAREGHGSFERRHEHLVSAFRRLADETRHRAIPDVGLERVEVDQPHLRFHVAERAGEVVGLPRQVLEDRVVLSERAGDVAATLPLAPRRNQSAFERAVLRIVVLRRRREQVLERVFRASESQILRDPALSVTQVPESLLAEIVRHAVLPHTGDLALDLGVLLGRNAAQRDLEPIADAVLARQRVLREADRFDLERRRLETHRSAAANAHELRGDALAVLHPGQADLGRLHARRSRQLGRSFERRQLLLRDTIDAELTGFADIPILQELPHTEVLRFRFDPHGARNFPSCLRARARSAGIGDSTVTRPSPPMRGNSIRRAWSVSRSMSGVSM